MATSDGLVVGSVHHSTLANLLWVERSRHVPAVLESGHAVDYAVLRARAGALARALIASGLTRDDRVGILLDRGADAVAAFFGTIAAGGIAVLIAESSRPRQIEHVIKDAGVVFLLTTLEVLSRLPRPLDTSCRTILIDELDKAADFNPVPRVGADAAQVVYTSGSTGLPKGVIVSHANLWASAAIVTAYLGITAGDRIAGLLPFSFVYGLSQVLCALSAGATLVIDRTPLPQDLVASLRRRDVTVLAAVPPLWLQLLAVPAFSGSVLRSLRCMTNAGGHLPVTAVRALRQAQPQAKLFLMYGLTEVLRSTFLAPEEVDRRPDSIGKAIPGAEVLVVRDDLTPCTPGEVGELVHRGPTVTLGYWNRPDATAHVFRPHSLRPPGVPESEKVVFSGDLVRRDEEGFLYYVGRRDRIIKTLGYRVSPDEVANVLYESGELAECVVTAEPDEQRGQRIVAFIVLVAGGSMDRLKRHAGFELPPYMQPTRFEVRDALPRLPSGKHDVAAIHAERGTS